MNITAQEIINDLITRPGLGMFAWLCIVFFGVAVVFFIWALKSGQLNNLEQSKFDMLNDNTEGTGLVSAQTQKKKETNSHG